jgi:preprotein translocase subunit SecF
MRFSFVKASRLLLPLSAIALIGSIVVFFNPGPQVSIEFTGGTLMEVDLPEGKTDTDLRVSLASFTASGVNLADASLSETRTGSWFMRTKTLDNDQHTALLSHLDATLGDVQELQYTTIGPTVGASLKQRSFWALLAASIAIVVFLAATFRKIPKSLSPWAFGINAIIAVVHDVVITVGIFTILSWYTTFQIDTLFITALLSIMGYSVSDTIVIFDRVRDNLVEEGKRGGDFSELADRSLRQSFMRTINTGLGALIMLIALFIFGTESIRWFILALIVGTLVGTYSSYFVATPLLVFWQKRMKRN